MSQIQMYGAFNKERTQNSVVIDIARQACYVLHHVEVPNTSKEYKRRNVSVGRV